MPVYPSWFENVAARGPMNGRGPSVLGRDEQPQAAKVNKTRWIHRNNQTEY